MKNTNGVKIPLSISELSLIYFDFYSGTVTTILLNILFKSTERLYFTPDPKTKTSYSLYKSS